MPEALCEDEAISEEEQVASSAMRSQHVPVGVAVRLISDERFWPIGLVSLPQMMQMPRYQWNAGAMLLNMFEQPRWRAPVANPLRLRGLTCGGGSGGQRWRAQQLQKTGLAERPRSKIKRWKQTHEFWSIRW